MPRLPTEERRQRRSRRRRLGLRLCGRLRRRSRRGLLALRRAFRGIAAAMLVRLGGGRPGGLGFRQRLLVLVGALLLNSILSLLLSLFLAAAHRQPLAVEHGGLAVAVVLGEAGAE